MTAGVRRTVRRFGALLAVLATGLATVPLMVVPAAADITVSPTTLEFGRVAVGTASPPQQIRVQVEAGERVVENFAGVGIRSQPHFPLSYDGCSGTVGPTECVISIQFAPEDQRSVNDVEATEYLHISFCESDATNAECYAGERAEGGADVTRGTTLVVLHGVIAPRANHEATVIAITGPQRVAYGTSATFVAALKDDVNNPLNGHLIAMGVQVWEQEERNGENVHQSNPKFFSCPDRTTGTLPATATRPQIEGAVVCEVPVLDHVGFGTFHAAFGGTDSLAPSSKEFRFMVDPAPGGTGQAQQGLTIEENDEAPALAPPPSSLTTPATSSTPPPATNTPPPETSTATQAPPMTPLQVAQQTVASFSPSQLATMTPQQLSGAVASMLSPQQMASLSITDRLQIAGMIQQLVGASVRAKLAAAGIGG
jgi:hypothetical protein